MQVRFLLGPAGSGKTHRCLAEIRRELARRPDGPPLILLAPKQATFQLERQLLGEGSVGAYTRLRILSFARLAEWVGAQLGEAPPRLVSEQGRLMVLRAILLRKEHRLGIFRASAGRPGFARELSLVLRELQEQRIVPGALRGAAEGRAPDDPLGRKLQDLALLLEAYTDWLARHDLRDAGDQLEQAAAALRRWRGAGENRAEGSPGASCHQENGGDGDLLFGGVWLDAFSELTPGERWLLSAMIPHTPSLTLTFCLESDSSEAAGWLSAWSPIARLHRACLGDFSGREGVDLQVEMLPRSEEKGRFSKSPMLAHLERHWEDGRKFERGTGSLGRSSQTPQSGEGREKIGAGAATGGEEEDGVAFYEAGGPEEEAVLACREIRRFARAGGRYRDAAILLRRMDVYEDVLPPLLERYEIPYFIDRREPLARHPLAALTHYTLRALTHGWETADLFGAWKTGFFPVEEEEIDRLENEALARGWRGKDWRTEIGEGEISHAFAVARGAMADKKFAKGEGQKESWTDLKRERLEGVRRILVGPLEELEEGLGSRVNGAVLAEGMGRFWNRLQVEARLVGWDQEEKRGAHLAAWREMEAWRETLALAFADQELALSQWLVIAEAGLAGLTAGTVPPSLDQVLIGAIDRSRNPDLELAVVLGLNEGVFPLAPPAPKLLTELERGDLSQRLPELPGDRREFIGRERFLGYIACTRARKRLVLARPARDLEGKPLNPSAFFSRALGLFPGRQIQKAGEPFDWETAEHPSELLGRALREERVFAGGGPLGALAQLPAMRELHARLPVFRALEQAGPLPRELVAQVFGNELRTSISALQRFAACPFQFFVHRTLRGRERALFELDARERGNFFHEVLAAYHRELTGRNLRWRDVTPEEARERTGRIAAEVARNFDRGLLRVGASARFSGEMMTREMVDFIGAETAWMKRCLFDPWKAESRFGAGSFEEAGTPAWRIALAEGRTLSIEGQIDRVDAWRDPASGVTHVAVVDYKSSEEKLDEALMNHGIALQLPAYLNVLIRASTSEPGGKLEPAGMFYAPLRPSYKAAERREDRATGEETWEQQWKARQFRGRFAAERLGQFDSQAGPGSRGTHYAFHLKKGGAISQASGDAVPFTALESLLQQNETIIRALAERIYAGEAGLDPWKKAGKSGCDFCDCQAVCRTDPWTQTFRTLTGSAVGGTEPS